jgi:hypothetical protein
MWMEAMKSELKSIEDNQVADEVDLPNNRKAVKSKWVFALKKDSQGNIVRYKARLVAKGYSQIEGVDYQETFSPVVRFDTFRLLCAIAAKEDWEIQQVDVEIAFLNGELKEDIYMKQPTGFKNGKKVWKLKKALYGLKQAGRVWYQRLDQELKKLGFKTFESDPCVYSKDIQETKVILIVYVDDMLFFSRNLQTIEQEKDNLRKTFKLKDLGEASLFLGNRIIRDRRNKTLKLDQEVYCEAVLKRFEMEKAGTVGMPIEVGEKLSKADNATDEELEEMKEIPYMEAIGSLMYLSVCTRPDISFAVSHLSRYSQNPGPKHWTAVKRVFRYLKGTKSLGITYSGAEEGRLIGYSDADWRSDIDDSKSISGNILFYAGGPISWTSKKQSTVAHSTAEAEYVSLSAAGKNAEYFTSILAELGFNPEVPIIYSDSQSAIRIASQRSSTSKTRHIRIPIHYVRELLSEGRILIKYVNTNDMIADGLTKGIGKETLMRHRMLIGLCQGRGYSKYTMS